MKNLLVFIILFSLQPYGFSQVISNLDEVSQINENLVAIKKGSQWGFINRDGLLIIDFRDDFVVDNEKPNSPPYFKDGRCLIKKLINDAYLFGYIDAYGNEIIKTQYLNASNLILRALTVGIHIIMFKPC